MEGVMYKRSRTLLVAIGFSLIVATNASAYPIAALGARTPAIAIDPALDRGMVVYENGGRIYGKFVDNTGRSATGSDFLVFPVNPASDLKYKDPAVVFKTPQNRFYIAARQSFSSRFNLPSGPIVFDTADGIAVTAFDAAGTRLATRTLYTPGFLRNPLIENAEARPAIAVDTFTDANCCVAVAWEDARAPTQLQLMRLSPDLVPFDAAPRAIATPAGSVTSLSATYNRMRDRFAFAYDGCSSPGRGCNAYITALPALLDGAAAHLMLPERVSSRRNQGYPSIAYVPGADRYLVSWSWSTYASGSVPAESEMAVAGITTASSGAMTAGAPLWRLGGSTRYCAFCSVTPKQKSQVVAVGATARAMVVAPSRNAAGSEQPLGYAIDLATMSVTSRIEFNLVFSAYIPTASAAYSPSGRVVGTWQDDTLEAGVWSASVAP
jgi:hypothetical protein